jgi:hypothetical protein
LRKKSTKRMNKGKKKREREWALVFKGGDES